jgi:hypothetical protein
MSKGNQAPSPCKDKMISKKTHKLDLDILVTFAMMLFCGICLEGRLVVGRQNNSCTHNCCSTNFGNKKIGTQHFILFYFIFYHWQNFAEKRN